MGNLLLVDDDHDTGDLLGDILHAKGHEIRVARSGHEGLRRITERAPDLLLLDVEMPLLSGPEMAYLLMLRNCGDEKIPVLLLSGIVGLDRVAAEVGTPYFLAKPYEVAAVLRLVDRALVERTAPTWKIQRGNHDADAHT